MIVIGSVALGYHMHLDNPPNDLDLVGTYDEAVAFRKKFGAVVFFPINEGKSIFMKNAKGEICEIEIMWEGSRAEKFTNWLSEEAYFQTKWVDIVDIHGYPCHLPSLDVLYMLKMSHRYLRNSPSFLKTMRDIQKMRAMGCTIRPEHQEFYEERMRDTYTYAHPKLNQAKDSFFSGDGIVYEWQHDDLHEAVKHLDKPAYQYYAGGEVWSDMKVFVTLSERIKLLGVLEEALVLAAERSQLAFPDKNIDPKVSFDMALEKVCTSICSGVFRQYAYDSYDKVQALYAEVGYDYMERVRKGIETGVVRRTQSA